MNRLQLAYLRFAMTCLSILLFHFSAAPLEAQSTFGEMVPGAQVALTNVDEHTQHTAATDADGAFHFVNLKPGHYELLVAAAGFAEYKMTAVQLDARQSLRLEVALKLASAAQSIEVGGESGPVINTENATIGDTKDFSQITNLPVNYRGATTSPLAMLATVPGAQQDANGNVSVGGGLPSQVQYSVDGSSTVNIRQNGALGNMNPSSELISEFKVTQFNNNAEFSQLGDVTISTKSGTERFHGSAFEYFQNSALDAAVWGSSYVWRKPGRAGGEPGARSRKSQNIFLRGLRRQSQEILHAAVFVCSYDSHAERRFLGASYAVDGSVYGEAVRREQNPKREPMHEQPGLHQPSDNEPA